MVDGDLLFLGAGEDFEGDEKTHYEEFKKAILDALNEDNGDNTISFTYHPEDLSMWRSEIQKNRDEIVASHKFLSKLCCEQLYEMLICCTPQQINEFRAALVTIYQHAYKGDFDENEAASMAALLKKLEDNRESAPTDKIVCYQLNLLIKNLKRYLDQIQKRMNEV